MSTHNSSEIASLKPDLPRNFASIQTGRLLVRTRRRSGYLASIEADSRKIHPACRHFEPDDEVLHTAKSSCSLSAAACQRSQSQSYSILSGLATTSPSRFSKQIQRTQEIPPPFPLHHHGFMVSWLSSPTMLPLLCRFARLPDRIRHTSSTEYRQNDVHSNACGQFHGKNSRYRY